MLYVRERESEFVDICAASRQFDKLWSRIDDNNKMDRK